MTMIGYGTLMSGAGSLASALFGGGGKGGSRTMDQMYQDYRVRKQIPLLMQGAKEGGIHPLAALGVNPSIGTGVRGVGGSKPNWGKALKGMGAAVSDYGSVLANKEFTEARTDMIKKQTELLQQEIDQNDQSSEPILTKGGVIVGQPNSIDTSDWFTRPQIPMKTSRDIEAGAMAADKWTNKRGVYVLNPTEKHAESVGEMVMPQIVDATIDAIDRVHIGGNAILFPKRVASEIIRLRNDLIKNEGAPPLGTEYQFHPFLRGFSIQKKQNRLIKGMPDWMQNGKRIPKLRKKFPSTKQRWRNNPTWQRLRERR